MIYKHMTMINTLYLTLINFEYKTNFMNFTFYPTSKKNFTQVRGLINFYDLADYIQHSNVASSFNIIMKLRTE